MNKAVLFNGTSGKITVSDDSAMQNIFDGGGSVEIDIYISSDGENSQGIIISKGVWYLRTVSEAASKVKLEFIHEWSGNDGTWITTATEVDLDTWTHIILTYDSDAVGNNPILYVSGSSVTLTESITPTGARDTDVGSDLVIGNRAADDRTLDGKLVEARLYTRILGGFEILRPNAAGAEANLLSYPNTGEENYEDVDEVTSDEDSTYVYSALMSLYVRDLYNIADSIGSGTIQKITVYAVCRCAQPTVEQVSLKIVVKSGTTTDEGSAQEVTNSFVTYSQEWVLNPDDGGAWGWDDIDSLQIGISLRAARPEVANATVCTQIYVEVDQTEVAANYNGGAGRYWPSDFRNLVGWWHLNEGTGTNVRDETSRGNAGTIATATFAGGFDFMNMTHVARRR